MSKKKRTKGLLKRLRKLVSSLQSGAFLRKEELASRYKARQHEIHQCLQQLNLEGLISQAEHTSPDKGCWYPDVYIVL